jgi:methyl-accepting chemotaxis protein
MPAFDLRKRIHLLNITDTTIANLRAFHPLVLANLDDLISDFYKFVLQMPATSVIFRDYDIEKHLKPAQRRHWDLLFSGNLNDEYVDQSIRIGAVHYKRKVAPYLYIAGYNYFHCELIRLAALHYHSMDMSQVLQAIAKAIALDIDLALTTYTRQAWTGDQ